MTTVRKSNNYTATLVRTVESPHVRDRRYHLELISAESGNLFTVVIHLSMGDLARRVIESNDFAVGANEGEYPDAEDALDAAKSYLHTYKRKRSGYCFVEDEWFDPKEFKEWKAAASRHAVREKMALRDKAKTDQLAKATNQQRYDALFDGLGESW